MWTILLFNSPIELQTYLRTTSGALPQDATKVVSIYFDGASGKHVLVLKP
jgi:hypothetical protein